MGTITSINGIAENNISHHNGGAASLYTSRNGDTWVHWTALAASGGSVTTSGNYKYHTFTSSANFTVTTVGHGVLTTCWLVGGGAGSTGSSSAGAGGGGWDQFNTITVSSATSYYVTVGGGGTAGGATTSGGEGGTTSIATLTYSGSYTMQAHGGGTGAGSTHEAPDDKACGGGASSHGGGNDYGSCTGGTYTPYNGRRQGYDGGDADAASIYVFSAAGGGGAGQIGYNARRNDYASSWSGDPNGSKGGNGLPINIGSGNVYYGGGGAGSTNNYVYGGVVTAGGNGGGGSGGGYATTVSGTAGTTNRGGGGGGSYTGAGVAGGSGICIIKYQYQQ